MRGPENAVAVSRVDGDAPDGSDLRPAEQRDVLAGGSRRACRTGHQLLAAGRPRNSRDALQRQEPLRGVRIHEPARGPVSRGQQVPDDRLHVRRYARQTLPSNYK